MPPDKIWILIGKKKNGEATRAELEELEYLLREYPNLGFTSELIEKLWDGPLGTVPQTQISKNVWFKIEDHISTRKRSFKLFKLFQDGNKWIAAVVLLILFASVWIINRTYRGKPGEPDSRHTTTNSIVTQPGSKSKIELPDGTQVWLNANSQLRYANENFGTQAREITLTGEAFFDVTKNAKVPFILHTGSITITVKGTAFNVKAYPNQKTIETSLVRGLIEITTKQDPDRKILLKPNEKIVIPVDETKKVAKASPELAVYSISTLHNSTKGVAETTWLNSRFEFDNEAMDELAPKIESWFNVKIHFLDDEIKSKRFSGVVEKETLEQMMEAMQLSYHFTYKIKENELWIGLK